MGAVLELECPRCGRLQDGAQRLCGLCGNLLRREAPIATHAREATTKEAREATARAAAISSAATTRAGAARPEASAREPWLYLALGLATAPVFGLTPILKYMGWFLAALVHEMGHAGFAWLCGMPAFPAISLAGHAAAIHGEQQLFVVLVIAALLGSSAWRFFEGRARTLALVVLGVLYPAIALTGAKELLHLLAGHGAELVFATLCLWKTLDGGFTGSRTERALYGTVGWYLAGKNALLAFGLATSAAARAEYRANGSFGLTNDLIRAAEDVLAWRLETVAGLVLVASLCVVPLALGLARLSRSMRRAAWA